MVHLLFCQPRVKFLAALGRKELEYICKYILEGEKNRLGENEF